MQSDAPLKMPDACASLGELREAIDMLDARLVALLAVRQAYIERAARLKTESRFATRPVSPMCCPR